MFRQSHHIWLCSVIALTLVAAAPYAEIGDAVVASDHALASQAGAEILAQGGNAVDAAVATALAAGVVQPAGSGLGGGGFAIWSVSDDVGTVDFRERAPSAATSDMYVGADGEIVDGLSRRGGLAVAVPGEPRGLAWLVETHGTLPLSQVARPAVRLAKRGFPLGAHLDGALDRTRYETIQAEFPEEHRPGTWVERKALGRTIARWARSGGDSLYTGSDGEALADHVQAQGGIVTAADLADYSVKERDPVVVQFHDYTVVSMGPPSSGGVVLGQVLQVLADDDLQAMGHNSSAYIHRVTEALKHAYADRARDLGDPDFVEVPVDDLISQARVEAVRRAFNPDQTLPNDAYGRGAQLPEDHGTQHISVVDSDGGACALTTTVNTSFGSGVVVPGLGLILNNEMDDFASQPGVPNAYGLVGGVENAIEPGKRPLSSTTPTLVLDADGNVVMSVGASGGSTIISSVIQVILNVTVFELDPQEAVARARFHHQWKPDILFLEPEIGRDVQDALTARGHTVDVRGGYSAVQVVTAGAETLAGGADPRKGGWPAGVWMSDD